MLPDPTAATQPPGLHHTKISPHSHRRPPRTRAGTRPPSEPAGRRLPPRARSATDPPADRGSRARGAAPPSLPPLSPRTPSGRRRRSPSATHLGAPAGAAGRRGQLAPLRARGMQHNHHGRSAAGRDGCEGTVPTTPPPAPSPGTADPTPAGSRPLSPTSHPPRAPPSLRGPAGRPPPPPPAPGLGREGAGRRRLRGDAPLPPRRRRGPRGKRATRRSARPLHHHPAFPPPRCPSSPRLRRGGRGCSLHRAPRPPPPPALAPAASQRRGGGAVTAGPGSARAGRARGSARAAAPGCLGPDRDEPDWTAPNRTGPNCCS